MRKIFVILIPFFIGITFSTLSSVYIFKIEEAEIIKEFQTEMNIQAFMLERELVLNFEILYSLKSLFDASKEVTKEEFHAFASQALKRRSTIQALEWVPYISQGNRDKFESEARKIGYKQFQITERKAQGPMTKAEIRSEYFPVYFMEPYEKNKLALGYDLASDPKRRSSLLKSRDTGFLEITAPIDLVQEKGNQKAFLAYLPVYNKVSPNSVDERRKTLQGFVIGVYRIGDIVHKAFFSTGQKFKDIRIILEDKSEDISSQVFYRHNSFTKKEVLNNLIYQKSFKDLLRRQWLLTAYPTKEYFKVRHSFYPYILFLGGVIISILFSVYVYLLSNQSTKLSRSNEQLKQEVVDRLKAEDDLKETNDFLEMLLNNVTNIVIVFDLEGYIRFINQAGSQILGYSIQELEGVHFSDLIMPEAFEGVQNIFQKVIKEKKAVKKSEVIVIHKDKNTLYLSFNLSPLIHNGEVISLVAAAEDITHLKLNELALRGKNIELKRSNSELREFASIASHDLLEPLRKILVFGDRLKQKFGSDLSEKAYDYLDRMQRAARRMDEFIKELLEYSRVTTKAKPFVLVHINEVIKDALYNLEIRIEQSKGKVIVEDLPSIQADPIQMIQLFQNLIANALKFHSKDIQPVVKIYNQTLNNEESGLSYPLKSNQSYQIIIEDNGIGIEEKFLERIFDVFQRLHARSDYDGSGIGLAVCRKIVERHNGKIIAKSNMSRGTQFIVTLPKEQMDI